MIFFDLIYRDMLIYDLLGVSGRLSDYLPLFLIAIPVRNLGI